MGLIYSGASAPASLGRRSPFTPALASGPTVGKRHQAKAGAALDERCVPGIEDDELGPIGFRCRSELNSRRLAGSAVDLLASALNDVETSAAEFKSAASKLLLLLLKLKSVFIDSNSSPTRTGWRWQTNAICALFPSHNCQLQSASPRRRRRLMH